MNEVRHRYQLIGRCLYNAKTGTAEFESYIAPPQPNVKDIRSRTMGKKTI